MGVDSIRRTSKSFLAVTAAMLMLGATQAFAALLAPGGAVAPTAGPGPAGAQVANSGPVVFVALDATSFSGTLTTRVFNNDPANPFGANRLTFAYQLTNNGPDSLERFVSIDFTGYQTDVNTFGPGIAAPIVDRGASGKVVGWDYTNAPNGIPAGQSSSVLYVHTNATQFVPVQNSVINGSVASVASFGPFPIPEPSTLGVVGIAGLALVARRRTR